MTKKITTWREAAQLTGLTHAALRQRVQRGHLNGPPWAQHELEGILNRQADGARHGARSAHGTISRWSSACDCDSCKEAHLASLRDYRRQRSIDELTPVREQVLNIFRSGGTWSDVFAETGLSQQRLHGIASWNKHWKRDLDRALMEGRDPNLKHGTASAWKSGCRCPECRNSR